MPSDGAKPAGGKTFLQKMMESQGAAETAPTSDPFGASASAMFNDFERVKSQDKGRPGTNLPPNMGEGDLDGLEKQFMGMLENITK